MLRGITKMGVKRAERVEGGRACLTGIDLNRAVLEGCHKWGTGARKTYEKGTPWITFWRGKNTQRLGT